MRRSRNTIERERPTQEALQHLLGQLRLLTARVQRAREEEAKRVAREIHDELGQTLTAIKIELSSLVHDLPTARKRQSADIVELVDGAIQSVRRICTDLRPSILDDLGFVAALEWAVGEFEARTRTRCRLDLPRDEIAINQECTTALFRIFQETLANVARHANATEVSVRLTKEDGNLALEVHDNGTGISEERLSGRGSLGILGMRERAQLIGAEFTITGGAGKGTTVRVGINIPEVIGAIISPPSCFGWHSE
jgi:signal transduction histidine kinase